MKRRLIILVFILFLIIAALPASVLATSTPMLTWGTVTLDGAAAPVGTTVDIYVGTDITPRGSCTVTTAGQYGQVNIWADDSRYGEPLTYRVNGFIAQKLGPGTAVFGLQNQVVNLLAVSTSPVLCWGTVTLNGAGAQVGTAIDIYIGADTTPSGSGTVTTAGQYGAINVMANPSRYGEPLTYKVNGFIAHKLGPGTAVFGLQNQEVNLEVVLDIEQSFEGVPRNCVSTPCCVTFTNLTTGGTTPYASATWDFGDNTGPVIQTGANAQAGQTVTHCYQNAGVFDVTLTMEDAVGAMAYQVEFDYITVGYGSTEVEWSFYTSGLFPKHLPDTYTGQIVLSNLDVAEIPDEVQGIYWYDCSVMEWKFWAPDAPGCTLATLGDGYTSDYLVSVTGPCDWGIPITGDIPTPTPPPSQPHEWRFCSSGFFAKHLPDGYISYVVLDDLIDVPSKVQGVYWHDGSDWLFWAPGAPGCTLATLGGGHKYDYMVAVTGPCDWDIPLIPDTPPPIFGLSPLSISPQEAFCSQTVYISTTLSNTGGVGLYQAELEINESVVDSKDVVIPSGGSTILTFPIVRDDPGIYNVQIGSRKGSFTVSHPPLNMMLDYVGVTDDHNPDGPGEIFLLVIVDDGTNRLVHAIPLEGQPDYEIPNYDTEYVGKTVFTTGRVGDYYRVAVLAYHRFEKSTIPWGDIGAAVSAGTGSIWPGIIGQVIEIINNYGPDYEYVGSYTGLWSRYNSWGIGQYNGVGADDLRLWFRIWSDSPQEPVSQPFVGFPNVIIHNVDIPSEWPESYWNGLWWTNSRTNTITLRNWESHPVDVRVERVSSFYPENVYTDYVTVPANDYYHIQYTTTYRPAGVRTVTIKLFCNDDEIDSWSGEVNVIPH